MRTDGIDGQPQIVANSNHEYFYILERSSRIACANICNSGSISEGLGKFKACFHLYGACTRGLGCLLRPHQNRRSAV